MGDKVNKAQKQQAGAPTSSDYQQAGLKVLARIIARVHLEKASGKEKYGGTHNARKRYAHRILFRHRTYRSTSR